MGRDRRQPHTKTFTGCWTCRARRVKCDEQTPACQRCARLGVSCEGYGIRLTWLVTVDEDPSAQQQQQQQLPNFGDEDPVDRLSIAGPKPKRSPSRRSSGLLGRVAESAFPTSEIEAMLQRIDECPPGTSRSEKGIFSVYPSAPSPLSTTNDSQTHSIQAVDPTIATLNNEQSSPVTRGRDATPGPDPAFGGHGIAEDTRTPFTTSTPVFNLQQPTGDNISAFSTLDGPGETPKAVTPGALPVHPLQPVTAQTPYFGPREETNHGQIRAHAPPPPPRHLDLLQMPGSQKRLIHHWLTFTSTKLVLVDEPHNPCRTMMLPMALRGLVSGSADSTADIATFHAICACAAYNLYELGGRISEEDQALALKHDQQAIHHLRHNLVNADQHRDQSFAMAIMACITIEAISGSTRRWRTHVSGGLAYLTKLRSRGTDLDMSSAFQAHMVSMAIMCGCDVPPDLKSFLHGAQSLELTFPYYGASSSFLRNQDHMNMLAASAATTQCSTYELDAFELQLYLDFPPVGLQAALPKTHATMLHHMAQAFYYASLVFFQRSVRRMPVDSVQTLVDTGVRQLEAIETVSQGSAGSVMMWPALVLGAECGTLRLQTRMAAWFQSKKKLGFRNVAMLEDLIRCVWANRTGTDPVGTSWQDLIVEERFDIFRL